ncbi:hypothetical protein DPMN_076655 [Dreissena polymorpha]|uniref:Uncharacterized protein n=1 Tax=Dreissena polymorpha TaxID=45954 RepID=A0A9D3YMS7_DREPO|nr:hypothetical protein DPMN_076655 [Dreissena polymorpha]
MRNMYQLSFHMNSKVVVVRYQQLFTLEESNILIDWFTFNCMQANPDKFQAIAVGKRTSSRNPSFDIRNANIKCDDYMHTVVAVSGMRLQFCGIPFQKASEKRAILIDLRA